MDKISEQMKDHYAATFAQHGATAKGVDWNRDEDVHVRYDKMLEVLRADFVEPSERPSLLDVGCGWGGLYAHARAKGVPLEYTGVDVVDAMAEHGRTQFPDARFVIGDVLDGAALRGSFDFVVCNGILTQKLKATIPDMERFAKALIQRMFALCRHGVAFNVGSTMANFMVDNLFYKSPVELLAYCLSEVTPRVKLDHGYSSLGSGKRRLYEFTVYLYKD